MGEPQDDLLELIQSGKLKLPEPDSNPNALETATRKLREGMERALHCTSESGHNWGPMLDGVMRCCVCGTEAQVEAEAEDEGGESRGPFGFAAT